MKRLLISILLAIGLSGCVMTSWFTFYNEVAVDTLYVTTQCPTFDHVIEIPGKKFKLTDVKYLKPSKVVFKLNDLVATLQSNKQARNDFNLVVNTSNQERLVKDPSASSDAERVVKRVFIKRKCPTYDYTPKFKAKLLAVTFVPEAGVVYVVVDFDSMILETQKNKVARQVYNEAVEQINMN